MRTILAVSVVALLAACSSSGGGGGDAGEWDGLSFKDHGNGDRAAPADVSGQETDGSIEPPDQQAEGPAVDAGGDADAPGPDFGPWPDGSHDADALADLVTGDGDAADGGPLPDGAPVDAAPGDCGTDGGCGTQDVATPDQGGQDAGGDGTAEYPPLEEGFAEPGLRILGPSATGHATSLGASIQVAGLVAGKVDSITWNNQTTGLSGPAMGAPFWLSGKVDLDMGDNRITVTATFGGVSVTDSIVVTYNPAFLFGSDLLVRPQALFVGAPTELVFTIDAGLFANFDANTLYLCESTPEGTCTVEVHKMVDDGQVTISGDEVSLDGVYSWRKTYTVNQAGRLCFRAHALVKSGYMQYSAFSPVTCVDVVSYITPEECESMRATLVAGKQLYQEKLAETDAGTARAALQEFLQGKPEVAEVGPSAMGHGLWLRFQNGLLGAYPLNPPGMRGGGGLDVATEGQPLPIGGEEVRVGSKDSIVLAPAYSELGEQDEAFWGGGLLKKSVCPAFVVSGPHTDAAATLDRFRELWRYGVILLAGHGDSYFKQLSAEARVGFGWKHPFSQEALWSGEVVDCSRFVQQSPSCNASTPCPDGSECVVTQADKMGKSIAGICMDFKQVDLRRGRIALGPDTYAVLPAFIAAYRGRGYPSSLVYLGACRSLWNGTLGMELFAAGAKAIVGYTGYVTTSYAYSVGSDFIMNVIEALKLTGDAMPVDYAQDPDNPGTAMRLLGAPNLNATNSELINDSFETGDLTGWQRSGDGRVITKLGISQPVEGKFMALVSTGMGFTPQIGEIYQTFCVPEGKTVMSFYWKLASEEFKEWCGSKFQDTFEASLEGDAGVVSFVDANIDVLCPPEECATCGSQYDGLLMCDFVLDQGGCWMTAWRKAEQNVAQLVGTGAVTLRYFVTDIGDSVFDTVVLLDTIKFK